MNLKTDSFCRKIQLKGPDTNVFVNLVPSANRASRPPTRCFRLAFPSSCFRDMCSAMLCHINTRSWYTEEIAFHPPPPPQLTNTLYPLPSSNSFRDRRFLTGKLQKTSASIFNNNQSISRCLTAYSKFKDFDRFLRESQPLNKKAPNSRNSKFSPCTYFRHKKR